MMEPYESMESDGPARSEPSTRFDPYHSWLGIPPDEQPANHYRLLGINLFECEREVIGNAADQRMVYLKTFGVGQHSELSQNLLNEVSAAKVCLLRPRKKRDYDQRLRSRLAPREPPAQPPSQPTNESPTQPPNVVSCPICGDSLVNDPSLAGRMVACPHCHEHFTMPDAGQTAPAAPAVGKHANDARLPSVFAHCHGRRRLRGRKDMVFAVFAIAIAAAAIAAALFAFDLLPWPAAVP